MRKKRRPYFGIFLVVLIALGIGAYMYLKPKPQEVSYLTEQAKIGNIRRTVNASGQIASANLVDVGAQASGQVEKLYVSLGQYVRRGDLIAEIESTTQKNELETSQAKLESCKTQLTAKEVALRVTRTAFERERQLARSDSTSRSSLDNAESSYVAAQAALADIQSMILQAEIAVRNAETNLGYTKITSPLDGTVVSIPVKEGQTVNAAQSAPTIVKIADLSEMEIRIEIAEGDVTKVRPGLPVAYTILSEPGMTFQTELHSIDPGLTTLSDGTYTESVTSSTAIYFYAKALVNNTEGRLRIGMTTENSIEIEKATQVLIVPNMALRKDPKGALVNVLGADGSVQARRVEIGVADNMNTQIISGLSEGEQVILTQLNRGEIVSNVMRGGPPMRF